MVDACPYARKTAPLENIGRIPRRSEQDWIKRSVRHHGPQIWSDKIPLHVIHRHPGVLSGVALAFARAVGEIGALILIAGNVPFKTEVASVFVFLHIQGGDQAGASAVAVVMLAISFALLLAIGGLRFLATRHERA